ncbi:lipoprotein [Spiroplasma citri]|uniref:Uncharacterized protein n=1 Tax=Spiroplasma citri TaxID=2133 RepID=A0AAJ4EKJ7_SPICI|nr:lipoprotein [Spiroplasma citri]APE75404.1 Hypothetical protein SCITRI_001529 [Spiroplasma citri]QED25275.1 hypothetical protein FRX96_08005 [Spiroplasma citri]QIA67619.1 hypothetical protein GMI18_08380 [Spiroplasma citri]QIA69468.1 hypothetical protein GL298_08295 [Spiroplasma citri]QIA71333.1 lipoprotein [Spiroplasma citri]
MKRLLSILSLVGLITTGTTNLISCGKPVVNNTEPNLKDENQKLKDENQKLKDENQKLKWKIDKNILFINSINPPIIINANKPNAVKEYELFLSLKSKVLESIKTIDESLTENDFIIAFKDYFNHLQPREIDLTISKKITIIISGKNRAHGEKEFDVVLPAAIPKV